MSVLELLDDYRVAQIELKLKGGRKATLDCVIRNINSPIFEATFLPDVLPVVALDGDAKTKLSFEIDGPTHTIDARIEEIESDTRLLLVALESFTHVQKRSFFRVDTRTRLTYCALVEEGEDGGEEPTTVNARVNLSAGGIRFPVRNTYEPDQLIRLEIGLEKDRKVYCVGRVIRMLGGTGDDPLEVAIEFEKIEAEDRDLVMSFCFAEQRKHLRMKISLLGGNK